MKSNNRIERAKFLFVAALSGMFTLPVTAQDYLDLKATGVRLLGATVAAGGYSIEEGNSLSVYCDWEIYIVDPMQYWNAKTTQTWSNRIEVDQQVVGTYPASVPQGTKMGRLRDGNSWKSYEPFKRTGSYGPGTWLAKGAGTHTVRCVHNTPKQVSDRYANNNLAEAKVTVIAKTALYVPPPKKPMGLMSTQEHKIACPKSLGAWLEADVSALNAQDLQSPPQKKKIALALVGSSPVLNTVQCSYGAAKEMQTFLNLKCNEPKKDPQPPHTYRCKD